MRAIVLAHGGAAEAVARHMPNWKAAFSLIHLISPVDDYLEGSFPMGQSERWGMGCLERLSFAMAMAGWDDEACVMEYDTLVLKKFHEVPADSLVCSVVYSSSNPKFTAKTFGHSPWVAKGEVWRRLLMAGGNTELGVPDRWLGLAAETGGINLMTFRGAFSCDGEWTEDVRGRARQAVDDGAPAVHGVKTAEDFAALGV